MKRWVVLLALPVLVWIASSAGASCITIHWTATGDDGHVGQASYYDIRYSRSGITEANFYSAEQVVFPPIPKESGSPEQWTICGLPSLTGYNVAIKAGDESGNWSTISNVAFFVSDDESGFRGDVNGNGVNYEVGDIVTFTNYFIYGLSVFLIDLPAQVAASDVNADGIPLSVSDLSHLIRVVLGDAQPILHKLSPYAQPVAVDARREDGSIVISAEAVSTIGAAYLVCKVDPAMEIGLVRLKPAASGMDLNWHRDSDELRILLFDLGRTYIEAGKHDLLEIPVNGEGEFTIESTDIADFESRAYASSGLQSALPSEYELAQNYPNPFNPSTTIEYALAAPSTVKIEVFNTLGQRVKTIVSASQDAGRHAVVWDGSDVEGNVVSSGVYFYRLTADDFTQSRKMLLLK